MLSRHVELVKQKEDVEVRNGKMKEYDRWHCHAIKLPNFTKICNFMQYLEMVSREQEVTWNNNSE